MKYEDIYIGQTAIVEHQITQSDISKFVELSGDDNKLHVNKDFAARTSFHRPVVHGMIGASFISTLIGTKLPGDGSLWFSQTLEFLLPARIGDIITVKGEIIAKNDKERSVEMKVDIINQNRQVITRGKSKIKVVEFEELEKETDEKQDINKVALVLGATGGIGFATCLKLAENGYKIIIHYNRNKQRAEELQRMIGDNVETILIYADINNEQELINLVSTGQRRLGDITLFVNCASLHIPPIKSMDLSWSDFESQLSINIKTNLCVIETILPTMIKNKYGKIVTIGSLFSDKPNMNLAHYVTAKSALEGFTKSMALELSPFGINVNMVSASMLDTELTSDIPQKTKLLTAAQTPLRRLAKPEDVASAINFLASDDASFLAGEIIRVNGGQYFK